MIASTPHAQHPHPFGSAGKSRLRRIPSLAIIVCSVIATLLAGPGRALEADRLEALRALAKSDPEAARSALAASLDNASDDAQRFELLEIRATLNRNAGDLDAAMDDVEGMQNALPDNASPVDRSAPGFLRGTILAERGALADALEQFQQVHALLADGGPVAERIRTINAIANTHVFLEDFARARDYYRQALRLARDSQDRQREATILGNLALAVAELDGPAAGLSLHRQALALAREIGASGIEHQQLANMCSRYVEVGELGQAEATCRDAIAALAQAGSRRLEAGARMSLGDLHVARGELEAAEQAYNAAMELAAGRVSSVEEPLLEKLAGLYRDAGRPAEEAAALRRLMALRETLAERRQRERLEELEMRYQVDSKQREIEMLQLDASLSDAQLRLRNLLLAGAIVALVLMSLLALVSWRALNTRRRLEHQLSERNSRLEQAISTISRLARHDELTGLYNRRAFLERAETEMLRSRRQNDPICIAIGDIDHFKDLNDQHGHAVGDQVLLAVARRMKDLLRGVDVVCRWGGEEFVFLLPGVDLDPATTALERLRRKLAERPVPTAAGAFQVTLTFGVARVAKDLHAALQQADRAMYRGKQAGRNRVMGPAEATCKSA